MEPYADGLLPSCLGEPVAIIQGSLKWMLFFRNNCRCCCSLVLRTRVFTPVRLLSRSPQHPECKLPGIGRVPWLPACRIGHHICGAPGTAPWILFRPHRIMLQLQCMNGFWVQNCWYNVIRTVKYSWDLQPVHAPSPCRFSGLSSPLSTWYPQDCPSTKTCGELQTIYLYGSWCTNVSLDIRCLTV